VKARWLFVTSTVAMALALPPVSSAQVPTQDSVSGTGATGAVDFEIDARSGPSGESPSGQVTFHSGQTVLLSGPVTCLSVNANVAILNVLTTQIGPVGFEITDSPAGDVIRAAPLGLGAPCSPFGSAVTLQVTSGDVAVVDAPRVPTSKDQCKQGGWRAYGAFKNQGDCVSFVATGGKNPPAISL
jgi:hypothetical protein